MHVYVCVKIPACMSAISLTRDLFFISHTFENMSLSTCHITAVTSFRIDTSTTHSQSIVLHAYIHLYHTYIYIYISDQRTFC